MSALLQEQFHLSSDRVLTTWRTTGLRRGSLRVSPLEPLRMLSMFYSKFFFKIHPLELVLFLELVW